MWTIATTSIGMGLGTVAPSGNNRATQGRFKDMVNERMRARAPATFSMQLTSLGDMYVLNDGIAFTLSKARQELVSARTH
jgi:hypothetical protein